MEIGTGGSHRLTVRVRSHVAIPSEVRGLSKERRVKEGEKERRGHDVHEKIVLSLALKRSREGDRKTTSTPNGTGDSSVTGYHTMMKVGLNKIDAY